MNGKHKMLFNAICYYSNSMIKIVLYLLVGYNLDCKQSWRVYDPVEKKLNKLNFGRTLNPTPLCSLFSTLFEKCSICCTHHIHIQRFRHYVRIGAKHTYSKQLTLTVSISLIHLYASYVCVCVCNFVYLLVSFTLPHWYYYYYYYSCKFVSTTNGYWFSRSTHHIVCECFCIPIDIRHAFEW